MWTPFEARTWTARSPCKIFDVIGPHTRCVDHLTASDRQRISRFEVGGFHTLHVPSGGDESGHPGRGGEGGAVLGGGTCQRHGVACVIDLRIPVLDRPFERGLGQRRCDRECLPLGQMPVPGERASSDRGEEVVERNACADVQPFPDLVGERIQERHTFGQVRTETREHQIALAQCFPHEAEVELLEVAKPTMEELARSAGGPACVVALFHESDRQTAEGGIEGDAGSGHAPADHDDVEGLRSHSVEIAEPPSRSENAVVGAQIALPSPARARWCAGRRPGDGPLTPTHEDQGDISAPGCHHQAHARWNKWSRQTISRRDRRRRPSSEQAQNGRQGPDWLNSGRPLDERDRRRMQMLLLVSRGQRSSSSSCSRSRHLGVRSVVTSPELRDALRGGRRRGVLLPGGGRAGDRWNHVSQDELPGDVEVGGRRHRAIG